MSWNAQRFARSLPKYRADEPALNIWLSRDAQLRLRADGGYVPDKYIAAQIVAEAHATYGTVHVGLAECHGWEVDCIAGGSSVEDVEWGDVRVLRYRGMDWHLEQAKQLAAGVAYQGRYQEAEDIYVSVSAAIAAGDALDIDGDICGAWTTGHGAITIHNTPLETMAAALMLFTDSEARSDAACVYERRTVPLKGKKGRGLKREADVHVIDVKRSLASVPRDSEGGSVEHDYRWVVRGHWRNQRHGKGLALTKRIWVQAHIAGPDDKPLRRDDPVYRIA